MREITVENKETTLISDGFSLLRQLCSFNADYTGFDKRPVLKTNRVEFIEHHLTAHNIPFTTEFFRPVVGTPTVNAEDVMVDGFATCAINVVVEIEGTNKDATTVFLAHHDVSNKDSENCVDNSASVANLLDLCIRLSKNKPANNVVVVFTDLEEVVRMTISGAKKLSQNILEGKYGNVNRAINLELTSNGQNYWMSYMNNNNVLAQHIRETQPLTHRVATPFNDSWIIERSGIPSVCVGSLDNNNLGQVKTRGYCSTWALCHSPEDSFERSANEGDMDLFVSWLETLI